MKMQAARKIKYAISQKLELIATNGLQIWIQWPKIFKKPIPIAQNKNLVYLCYYIMLAEICDRFCPQAVFFVFVRHFKYYSIGEGVLNLTP